MGRHLIFAITTAFGAAAAIVTPASAETCNGAAIDARFVEAARLCDDASPAVRPASIVNVPDSRAAVSVEMPGYRRATAKRAAAALRALPPGAINNPALIAAVGRRYRIDPHLLASMMHQESGGRMTAVSSKGALGLMQVMPGTARSVGVADPKLMLSNPVLALTTGAVYLKRLQAKFGNNVPLVLAAYNAGPGAVTKAGGRVPRYRETQGYVTSIMSRYSRVRGARTR